MFQITKTTGKALLKSKYVGDVIDLLNTLDSEMTDYLGQGEPANVTVEDIDPESTFYLGFVDSELVGLIQTNEVKHNNKLMYMVLNDFIVKDEHRREGYGRAILDRAVNDLKVKKKDMFINVHFENKQAMKLYSAVGFKPSTLTMCLEGK